MRKNELMKSATEINKILEYLPLQYVERVPIKLREFFKSIELEDYVPKIDPYKTLENQDIQEKTKTFLVIMYKNYWCEKSEKEELDNILIQNDKNYESELEKLKENNDFESILKEDEDIYLVESTKEKWYKEIFIKIMNLFRKK